MTKVRLWKSISPFICAWLSDQTEHNKMQGTASVSSPLNNVFKPDWA